MKEIVLVSVVVISVVLAFIVLKKIKASNKSENVKMGLGYLTILCPILGFLVTLNIKRT